MFSLFTTLFRDISQWYARQHSLNSFPTPSFYTDDCKDATNTTITTSSIWSGWYDQEYEQTADTEPGREDINNITKEVEEFWVDLSYNDIVVIAGKLKRLGEAELSCDVMSIRYFEDNLVELNFHRKSLYFINGGQIVRRTDFPRKTMAMAEFAEYFEPLEDAKSIISSKTF